MKIKIETKFNLGDLIIHRTAPGIIMMITGIRVYSSDWTYECEYMTDGGVILFVFYEYEIEEYTSQKGFGS